MKVTISFDEATDQALKAISDREGISKSAQAAAFIKKGIKRYWAEQEVLAKHKADVDALADDAGKNKPNRNIV